MSGASPKILVVDDEEELTSSLKESLEARGYRVVTALDGISAVDLARAEKPDLILLDLMLPRLDGYRVLKLLKSDERYKRTPILVITARANEEDWALAVECGADCWFVKPVQVDGLLNRVRAYLGDGHGEGILSHGRE